ATTSRFGSRSTPHSGNSNPSPSAACINSARDPSVRKASASARQNEREAARSSSGQLPEATSAATRFGCVAASTQPVQPPADCPQTANRSNPSASASASTSPVIASSAYASTPCAAPRPPLP